MRKRIIETIRMFRGLFCKKTSTFLISYHYTTISGEQGFGTCETTIEDRKFHYRNLSPVVESIKKDYGFKTVIILNIIKLQ